MNCVKCGHLNPEGANFCEKCGNSFVVENPAPQTPIAPSTNENITSQTVVTNPSPQPMVSPVAAPAAKKTNDFNIANYGKYALDFLINPFKAFKEKESELDNVKESFIFSGIIAVAMMVVNFVVSFITSMFVEGLNSSFSKTIKFDINGIKNLDYVSLIFKNLIIYAVVILAIAGVYYLATLIIKKSVNFSKLLAASASSMIPFTAFILFASPILGKIWSPLSIIFACVGIIYSIIAFVVLTSDIIGFDNEDVKIKFNAACISILILVGGYVVYKFLVSQLMGGLGNLLF